MFHLFTLQGKRIDAQLEHLPKNVRVHHTKGNSRVRKYFNGESRQNDSGSSAGDNYGANLYRQVSEMESEKSPVFHASQIMSRPVFTIRSDSSVYEAWIEFTEKKVHHMPVLSREGKMTGIISDRDLLRKLIISNGKVENTGDTMVSDIMSTDIIATSPLTDIRRIAKAMLDHHIGAMPVVDEEGNIAGIVTRSDILFAIIHQPQLKLWA